MIQRFFCLQGKTAQKIGKGRILGALRVCLPEYALACATVIPLLNQPRLFVVLKNSQKARDCEDDEKNNKPHHRLTHAHSSSNLTSKLIINRPRPIVNGFLIFAAIFRKSNSRSRKGCDDNIFATKAESPGFNSRTRKGCDNIELNDYIKKI